MRHSRYGLLAAAGLAFATTGAMAETRDVVANAADDEWISLTGKVEAVSGPYFTLDYGKGDITVEMDDFDVTDENLLVAGDCVTVTGKIDKDFYEKKKIEASSVYVAKLRTYFYADAADEEDGYYSYPVDSYARDDEWVAVTGTVVGDAEGDEIELNTGYRNLTVDLDDLDREIALKTGDRITVYGEMDDADLFEGREILASSVTVLSRR